MVTKHIVILGAGTGGTLVANRLRRLHAVDDVRISVVDQDGKHMYQPGLLFVPFGLAHGDKLTRPRQDQLHRGIELLQVAVERVDLADNLVVLADHRTLAYDVLVVATGATLVPGETDGLEVRIVPEWQEIAVGGQARLHPEVGLGVVAVERGRSLVLRGGLPMGDTPPPYDFTWAFELREHDGLPDCWFASDTRTRRGGPRCLSSPSRRTAS